jgi:hypothetical protein
MQIQIVDSRQHDHQRLRLRALPLDLALLDGARRAARFADFSLG